MENSFEEIGDNTSFTKSQFSLVNINFKRVLDVECDTESHLFIFQFDDLIKLAKSLKPTKRSILKFGTFYYPLGFTAPYISTFMQR